MPFGTIDTPAQGETVSGAAYVNYAWALTQAGKIIPFSGSTITVFVDGAPVGPASYNYYRSDIASFFPGLANTDGPAGFRIIDTTTLANGLHTIVWTVTDSGGATAGLGSRYFRVSNGTSAPVTLSEREPGVGRRRDRRARVDADYRQAWLGSRLHRGVRIRLALRDGPLSEVRSSIASNFSSAPRTAHATPEACASEAC